MNPCDNSWEKPSESSWIRKPEDDFSENHAHYIHFTYLDFFPSLNSLEVAPGITQAQVQIFLDLHQGYIQISLWQIADILSGKCI